MVRWSWTLVLVVAGCGGQVRDDGGTSGSGGSTESDAESPGGFGKIPLPPCEPGEPPPQPVCAYLASGLCYATKTEACACECRKTKGTICVSGFPGTMVEVSCP